MGTQPPKKQKWNQRVAAWLFRRIRKKLLKKIYAEFLKHQFPQAVESLCKDCIDEKTIEYLKSTPLHELQFDTLDRLLDARAIHDSSVDLRHFIPRMVEGLFEERVSTYNYTELTCAYVGSVLLDPSEQALLDQVIYLWLGQELALPEDETDEAVVFDAALTRLDCLYLLRDSYLNEISTKLKKNPEMLGKVVTIKDRLLEYVAVVQKDMSFDEILAWNARGSRQAILLFAHYTLPMKMPNMNDADFFKTLQIGLETCSDQYRSMTVESNILSDYSLQYNLYNPENFEDPTDAPDWYDPKINFEYYPEPYNKPNNVVISNWYNNEQHQLNYSYNFEQLKTILKTPAEFEQKIHDFFVTYTFHDGGAYAAGKHFAYAMESINTIQGTEFTPETFIKKLVQLREIHILNEAGDLRFNFAVSWDEEHGIYLAERDGKIIEVEI